MNDRSPDMLKPTLIAGVVFGAVAALPFFGILNCACCALIVGAGFFAAYLYSGDCRRQGAEFRAGTGAVVGLIAGAFYAMMTTLVGAVVQITVGDFVTKAILEWLQKLPNMPSESSDAIQRALEGSRNLTPLALLLGFFLNLLLGAIFSTVGGLIGGAVFKVERPTPPPAPSIPLPEDPFAPAPPLPPPPPPPATPDA
jgi:hypothetical protein